MPLFRRSVKKSLEAQVRAAEAGRASAAAADVQSEDQVAFDATAAAFFDVDNTMMMGASIFHFAKGLAARKFFTTRDITSMLWQQTKFRVLGSEDKDDMHTSRDKALAFVKGIEVAELVRLGEEIYDEELHDKIYPGTRALAQAHLDAGQRVWLVTATPVELAATIAERLGLTGALGTVAEHEDGKYTGRLVGEMMHGNAKAEAVAARLAQHEGVLLVAERRRVRGHLDLGEADQRLTLEGHGLHDPPSGVARPVEVLPHPVGGPVLFFDRHVTLRCVGAHPLLQHGQPGQPLVRDLVEAPIDAERRGILDPLARGEASEQVAVGREGHVAAENGLGTFRTALHREPRTRRFLCGSGSFGVGLHDGAPAFANVAEGGVRERRPDALPSVIRVDVQHQQREVGVVEQRHRHRGHPDHRITLHRSEVDEGVARAPAPSLDLRQRPRAVVVAPVGLAAALLHLDPLRCEVFVDERINGDDVEGHAPDPFGSLSTASTAFRFGKVPGRADVVQDMVFGFGRTPEMVSPTDALPGREQPLPGIPDTHEVLGTSMHGPWPEGTQVLYVAMGCFWGSERIFWKLPGVVTTAVGYMGGYTPNPTYEETCTGRTGHAEVVQVVFNPNEISYAELLKAFWENHDPTQGMRQGNDIGTQYRSAIYCTTPEQETTARELTKIYAEELARQRLGRDVARMAAAADEAALAAYPDTAPLPERPLGREFLYSSGTTGLPKPIERWLLSSWQGSAMKRIEGAVAVRALGIIIRKHPGAAAHALAAGLAQGGRTGVEEIKRKIIG